MDDQDQLVFADTVNNRLFGLPEVLDKNVDDIIVNECDTVLTKPPDRYHFGFIIFYILGTCLLLPWYFFMTANDYWMYKLRNLPNETQVIFLLPNDNHDHSRLQANFTSFLTIAASVPSSLMLLLNTYLAKKMSIHFRMISSLMLMLILFTITTILVNLDSDSWQILFFMITLGTVIFLNIGSSIMQGAVFNLVSFFDSSYMTATVCGQALGGIVAALAQILALWWGASSVHSAFVYFLFADIFILISLVLYTFLVKTNIYKYYVQDIPASVWIRRSSSTQYALLGNEQTPTVNTYAVLKKIWKLGLSTFYNFLVTMSVYPAVTVLITSVNKEHTAWTDTYFLPVIAYLLFSTCDFLGRVMSNFIRLPINSIWPSAILSALRTIFIPLMMLCNAKPRYYLPVLINNDQLYAVIMSVFGFTNGIVSNITMASIPYFVDKHEQEVASSLMITFLGIGISTGSLISFGMVNLL
ncbi:equilibrative nucleoside transporter 1 isoform X1 [Aphis gossypii]|uniref:equilibrative nucleoside transporter 1 isoform X1 n=2 Tax=Aphis gossypii TaxID=80765 RepID=UPI002159909C|nr:equilibrative nucleoside transporter 1 isoform X1 [Aphis gossypii]XP_027845610.2 equilibrative nucleoside transporter 1 isoform X1 [Aphis gossypii]